MALNPYPGGFSCTIKGKVTVSDNQPFDYIDIEWDPAGVGFFMKVAQTDANGDFTIQIAPIPRGNSTQIIRARFEDREEVLYTSVSPNTTKVINFTI